MANLTYTQIYAMTEAQLSAHHVTNMTEENDDDIISINAKCNAIDLVQRARKKIYPSIEEQLDMQYWDSVNGTTKWKEKVAEIKTANPLPQD